MTSTNTLQRKSKAECRDHSLIPYSGVLKGATCHDPVSADKKLSKKVETRQPKCTRMPQITSNLKKNQAVTPPDLRPVGHCPLQPSWNGGKGKVPKVYEGTGKGRKGRRKGKGKKEKDGREGIEFNP